MLFSYSFQNKKRDLSDILSTVVKDSPRFISNFRTVENAIQQKHEWLEDQISGRAVTALSAADGNIVLSAGDSAKLRKGTLLTLESDSALFAVEQISGNSGILRRKLPEPM